MSKRHQSSRRRSYGRRQHELRERAGHLVGAMGWRDEQRADYEPRWDGTRRAGVSAMGWLTLERAH
jgi:hypothetical protein